VQSWVEVYLEIKQSIWGFSDHHSNLQLLTILGNEHLGGVSSMKMVVMVVYSTL
jgi:hypothetical protein